MKLLFISILLFLNTIFVNAQIKNLPTQLYWFNKGKEDISRNELKAAIEDYTKIIELNPMDTQAYMLRGLTKYKLKKYKEAIKDYNKAIELNPSDAGVYNNRGAAKSDLLFYNEAIEDYNTAIKLNPNSDVAYFNRGLAYFNSGYLKRSRDFYKQAVKDYTKTLEINPGFSDAYYTRGLLKCNYLEECIDAIFDFEAALTLEPDNQDYRRALREAKEKMSRN
jgi:tetratricopeptide (TPR) repeat protein